MAKDIRSLTFEEVLDEALPVALATHGQLAARGFAYKQLAPLGLEVAGRAITLDISGSALVVQPGAANAGVVAMAHHSTTGGFGSNATTLAPEIVDAAMCGDMCGAASGAVCENRLRGL